LLELPLLRLVDNFLGPLDETQYVAHPEDALGDPIGIEGLKRVRLLAHAHELEWNTRHRAQRERDAAPGVAVHLRQDGTREREAGVEFFRHLHRVLPDHRVRDEEDFGWAHAPL